MLFEVNNTPEALDALEKKIRLQYDQLRSNIDLKDFDLRYKGYKVIVDVNDLNKITLTLQAQLINSAAFNTTINKNMSTIERSSTPPPETITAIDISEAQNKTILTWYDTTSTTQYFYTEAKVIKAPVDCTGLFLDCGNLINYHPFIDILDTGDTTSMARMFEDCHSIQEFSSDSRLFNTKNVVTMYAMFSGCHVFRDSKIGNFDMTNLEDISYMFEDCRNLYYAPIGNNITPKLKYMQGTFQGCANLSNVYFDRISTAHVKTMRNLFANCTNLNNAIWGSNFVNTSLTDLLEPDGMHGNGTSEMLNNCPVNKPWNDGVWTENGTFIRGAMFDTTKFRASLNNTEIIQFAKTDTIPQGITATNVSKDNYFPIMCWFDTVSKTQYWQSDGPVVCMDVDSSGMFMSCGKLKSVDLSGLSMNCVKNMSNLFNGCINLSSAMLISNDNHPSLYDCIKTDMFKNCSTEAGSWFSICYEDNYNNYRIASEMIVTKSTGGNITMNNLELLIQGVFKEGICTANRRYIQGKDSLINPIIPEISTNTISNYTSIHVDKMVAQIGNSIIDIPETTLTLTGGALGTNYYVIATYVSGSADGTVSISTSKIEDSTHKCIGGFHYGRIRQSFTISDVVEGIVPNSIWTCNWRPVCNNPDAMVYLGKNLWGDIYLTRIKTSAPANGDGGAVYDSSAFGALPGTGSEGFCQYTFTEALSKVGKRLSLSEEFVAAADGSPTGLANSNVNAWTASTNTARCACGTVVYAISIFNIVDMVGNVSKWNADKFGNSTYEDNGTGTLINLGYPKYGWVQLPVKGGNYGYGTRPIGVLYSGGYWSHAGCAGPRCVVSDCWPWYVGAWLGAWAVSEMR